MVKTENSNWMSFIAFPDSDTLLAICLHLNVIYCIKVSSFASKKQNQIEHFDISKRV